MKKLLFLYLLLLFSKLCCFEKINYNFSNESIDVIIPTCSKDLKTLNLCIDSIKENCQNIRRVIVISDQKLSDKAEWFNENLFPFNKKSIAQEIFDYNQSMVNDFLNKPKSRIGWILQQLLKLYAVYVIPNISSNILIVDSDVIWLNKVNFMNDLNEPYLSIGTEFHQPYFVHMKKLLPDLIRANPQFSGICHHMLMQKPILDNLFYEITKRHKMEPWKAICHCIDPNEANFSSLSEYEIYFNFAVLTSEQIKIRNLYWRNWVYPINIEKLKKLRLHYIAAHKYE